MNARTTLLSIQLVLCVAFFSFAAVAAADDAPVPDATVTVTAERTEPTPGSNSGTDNGVDPNDLNSKPTIRTLNNDPHTPKDPRPDPCADEISALREFMKRAEAILRPLRLELAILTSKGFKDLASKFELQVYNNSLNNTYNSEEYARLYAAAIECIEENGFERAL